MDEPSDSESSIPSFGFVDSVARDVVNFYDFWKNFSTRQQFTCRQEVIAYNDVICELVGKLEDADIRASSSREQLRREHKERSKKLRAEKKSKEMGKDAQQAASKKHREEQRNKAVASAREWAELATCAATPTKAQKEAAKKTNSKTRNTLKKLLRMTVTAEGAHLVPGEFGIVSTAEVEVIERFCAPEELCAIVLAFGGEPAVKNSVLFNFTAGNGLLMMQLERALRTQAQSEEDVKMLKDISRLQREKERGAVAASSSSERTWRCDESSLVASALVRYPPLLSAKQADVCSLAPLAGATAGGGAQGCLVVAAGRWELIHSFVNAHLLQMQFGKSDFSSSPSSTASAVRALVSLDEVLLEAHKIDKAGGKIR